MGAVEGLCDGAPVRVVNRSRGAVLAERADVAASPWRRMRGLLGRSLAPGDGLVIVPCWGVHTIGMAYPIDVVHVDRQGVVRRVLRELAPWRIGPLVWKSNLVLELPAGAAAAEVGDRLAFEPPHAAYRRRMPARSPWPRPK
jgi:uncharacterized membrane protein (UPF0127 family)